MKTTINNQQIFNIKSVEQQWKDIPGYEDIYQISDMGNVRSLDRTITDVKGNIREYKGKELAKIVNTAGYLYVNLYKEGVKNVQQIHSLMGITFLNHSQSRYIVVDHINNIKFDNRLSNLQIINQRENTSKDKKGYTSQYIGVCLNKKTGKYKSQIRLNGKIKYLGYYMNEIDAHIAYQKELENINRVS